MNNKITKTLTYVSAGIASVSGLFMFAVLFFSKPYTLEIEYALLINQYGGPVQGFMEWFNHRNSMPIKDFLQFLLIGVPNAYFDWNYSNIISLTVSVLAFAFSILYMLKKMLNIKTNIIASVVTLFVVIFGVMVTPVFAANVFKYFDFSENNANYYYWKFSNISWFWPGATVTYLLSTAVFILIATYLIYNPSINSRLKYLYIVGFGLFIGFGNANTTAIALAVLGIAGLFIIFNRKNPNVFGYFKSVVVLSVSTVLSFVSTTFMPGNVERQKNSSSFDYDTPFIEGLLKDLSILASPFYLAIPLAAGTVIFYVLKLSSKKDYIQKINIRIPLAFLSIGILSIVVNNLIAIVLYKALWHHMNPQIFIFVGGLLMGYKLAEVLYSKGPEGIKNISYLSLSTIVIFVSIFTTLNIGAYVLERSDKWWGQYSTHISCSDLLYFDNPEMYGELSKYRDAPKLNIEATDRKTCDTSNMYP